jgi:hypothetical protein
MRRRQPAGDGPGPPVRLLRYRYADWADESEPLSAVALEQGWPPREFHGIRAFKRYLAARRAYREEHGLP